MAQIKDIAGKRYGRWLVLSFVEVKNGVAHWRCVCDCGKEKNVRSGHLVAGKTSSCGCFQRENIAAKRLKHGHKRRNFGTRTYSTWCGMIRRCTDKNSRDYHRYGGRGITVCDRWKSFDNFLADMGEKPKGLSLDRINNNLGYSIKNCKWSTNVQQANNKRNNNFVFYMGETITVAELARKTDIGYHLLHNRIKRGWTIDDAVNLPKQKNGASRRLA